MDGPIRRLGQVALPAQNIERAIAFYRDALGLPFIWSNGRMAFFQLGAVRLLIDLAEKPGGPRMASVLYLDTADLDAVVAALKERGVVFRDDPHHIGDLGDLSVWMAFFHDSEGNLLALQEERRRST